LELIKRILFEDNHIIITYKEPGELVQSDKTGDISLSDSIKNYLKIQKKKLGSAYLGVVHRLDRPTSGVLVFAKTSKALTRLNEQFKLRLTKKIYWALVDKKFPKHYNNLSNWMTRNRKKNKSKAHLNKVPESKFAQLNLKRIKEFEKYCLLEIELLSGRHHQIRAQLSSLGFPIQGDVKYGAPRANKDKSISLHSKSLSFSHPISKEKLNFKILPKNTGIWKIVLYD
tara:strand:+ start:22094 stop:22777 length:684 start_codon:yes stop_codon:yes gene_type:complete